MELLGDLLPAAETELTGSLSGASDEDCDQDSDDLKDESNSGLVSPLIIHRPMPEPQPVMPWFFGLNLSVSTGVAEAENDGGESSGHTAAMSAPPHEPAQNLSPQLPDFMRQSETSPGAEDLQMSFAARLIAKAPDEESVGATRNSKLEASPVSTEVRFGTADSPVLNDMRNGAGGGGQSHQQAGNGSDDPRGDFAKQPTSSEKATSPSQPFERQVQKIGSAKAPKFETPVAGELHSSHSVNTIMTSATPVAESIHVTEAQSGHASATQQQAPETTALSEVAPLATDRPATSSTEPLRDLAIDVPAPTGAESNGRIQLQLTDRAGELRVRVRTSDSALSGLLQRDLGDLVSRLEDSGFDAQTWTPDSTKGIAETADTRMGSQADDGRDHESGSGNHSQHSREGREDGTQTEDRGRRHDRNRAPSWVEAWDRISAGATRVLRLR